jgi:phosphatidylethanolamine/phosphatidyl-N-methylethanolamine N-methyltransferase
MPARKNEDKVRSRLLFLRQFLSRPKEVASVLPSSEQLVNELIAGVKDLHVKTVLEYGPGTGAITGYLLDALPPGVRYLAAEPNANFREHLVAQGFEIEIIADYAQNIAPYVIEAIGEVDFIVSGLPLSVMPPEVLQSLVESTHRMLRQGGTFRQFIYTHTLLTGKMQRLMATLQTNFSVVKTSTVFWNFPPATIIRCIK